MRATFLFLGTGASAGVPIIGCDCAICQSIDSCNQRLRPSGLVQIGAKNLLIDIGPDFRQQALKHKICTLDGLLLTHTHYDHIAGIDELRVINYRQKRALPCLLSEESMSDLKIRYNYLFKERDEESSNTAQLDCQVLLNRTGETEFAGIKIGYTSYRQGTMNVSGFRIGRFAYISDIRKYEEDIFSFLEGVDHLVLSALRIEPSRLHFSLQEAVEFAQRAKVTQTWLTHLSHAVDHESMCRSLPENVQPGFDGQQFFFEG